jgi:hypothetical protein
MDIDGDSAPLDLRDVEELDQGYFEAELQELLDVG